MDTALYPLKLSSSFFLRVVKRERAKCQNEDISIKLVTVAMIGSAVLLRSCEQRPEKFLSGAKGDSAR